jgi:hypothetical protein
LEVKMSRKKRAQRHKGFIEMEAEPKTIILQTGRQTPPDSLLWDLDFVNGISIGAKRLGAEFLGGGVASFVLITVTAKADSGALAEAIYQHVQRLKKRGDDDLVVLLGGSIRSEEEEVSFKDVKCRRQVSLKGKSKEEIGEIIEEAMAKAE